MTKVRKSVAMILTENYNLHNRKNTVFKKIQKQKRNIAFLSSHVEKLKLTIVTYAATFYVYIPHYLFSERKNRNSKKNR